MPESPPQLTVYIALFRRGLLGSYHWSIALTRSLITEDDADLDVHHYQITDRPFPTPWWSDHIKSPSWPSEKTNLLGYVHVASVAEGVSFEDLDAAIREYGPGAQSGDRTCCLPTFHHDKFRYRTRLTRLRSIDDPWSCSFWVIRCLSGLAEAEVIPSAILADLKSANSGEQSTQPTADEIAIRFRQRVIARGVQMESEGSSERPIVEL